MSENSKPVNSEIVFNGKKCLAIHRGFVTCPEGTEPVFTVTAAHASNDKLVGKIRWFDDQGNRIPFPKATDKNEGTIDAFTPEAYFNFDRIAFDTLERFKEWAKQVDSGWADRVPGPWTFIVIGELDGKEATRERVKRRQVTGKDRRGETIRDVATPLIILDLDNIDPNGNGQAYDALNAAHLEAWVRINLPFLATCEIVIAPTASHCRSKMSFRVFALADTAMTVAEQKRLLSPYIHRKDKNPNGVIDNAIFTVSQPVYISQAIRTYSGGPNLLKRYIESVYADHKRQLQRSNFSSAAYSLLYLTEEFKQAILHTGSDPYKVLTNRDPYASLRWIGAPAPDPANGSRMAVTEEMHAAAARPLTDEANPAYVPPSKERVKIRQARAYASIAWESGTYAALQEVVSHEVYMHNHFGEDWNRQAIIERIHATVKGLMLQATEAGNRSRAADIADYCGQITGYRLDGTKHPKAESYLEWAERQRLSKAKPVSQYTATDEEDYQPADIIEGSIEAEKEAAQATADKLATHIPEFVSLEEGRSILDREVSDFVQADPMTPLKVSKDGTRQHGNHRNRKVKLIKVPLGLGKTATTIRQIADRVKANPDCRTVYMVQSHKLADQIERDFLALLPGESVLHYYGFDFEDEETGFRSCLLDALEKKIWIKTGPPVDAVCAKCPLRDECHFNAQSQKIDKAQVVIMADPTALVKNIPGTLRTRKLIRNIAQGEAGLDYTPTYEEYEDYLIEEHDTDDTPPKPGLYYAGHFDLVVVDEVSLAALVVKTVLAASQYDLPFSREMHHPTPESEKAAREQLAIDRQNANAEKQALAKPEKERRDVVGDLDAAIQTIGHHLPKLKPQPGDLDQPFWWRGRLSSLDIRELRQALAVWYDHGNRHDADGLNKGQKQADQDRRRILESKGKAALRARFWMDVCLAAVTGGRVIMRDSLLDERGEIDDETSLYEVMHRPSLHPAWSVTDLLVLDATVSVDLLAMVLPEIADRDENPDAVIQIDVDDAANVSRFMIAGDMTLGRVRVKADGDPSQVALAREIAQEVIDRHSYRGPVAVIAPKGVVMTGAPTGQPGLLRPGVVNGQCLGLTFGNQRGSNLLMQSRTLVIVSRLVPPRLDLERLASVFIRGPTRYGIEGRNMPFPLVKRPAFFRSGQWGNRTYRRSMGAMPGHADPRVLAFLDSVLADEIRQADGRARPILKGYQTWTGKADDWRAEAAFEASIEHDRQLILHMTQYMTPGLIYDESEGYADSTAAYSPTTVKGRIWRKVQEGRNGLSLKEWADLIKDEGEPVTVSSLTTLRNENPDLAEAMDRQPYWTVSEDEAEILDGEKVAVNEVPHVKSEIDIIRALVAAGYDVDDPGLRPAVKSHCETWGYPFDSARYRLSLFRVRGKLAKANQISDH